MRATGFLAMFLVLASAPAFAHAGAGAAGGFLHGLMHPLTGLDHVLAVVAVGLWAGLVGSKARIAYPVAFGSMMTLAGAWGMSGGELPGVEIGIAFSVVILGAAVALKASPPLAAGTLACGILAIFHGFAHGAELPETASGLAYALGFILATAALHLAGIMLAGAIATRAPLVTRIAGGGLVLAGVAFLAG
ncbi:MAG: HupE/UreJ family protein [Bosea sp.]|nr:HupE/UreJ family protein [Bosea sp. (in: a-proteobacteria)]MCP4734179.1 HupE/UreJ family protein [Bosea sp. (in: a-proteobacteria)]